MKVSTAISSRTKSGNYLCSGGRIWGGVASAPPPSSEVKQNLLYKNYIIKFENVHLKSTPALPFQISKYATVCSSFRRKSHDGRERVWMRV